MDKTEFLDIFKKLKAELLEDSPLFKHTPESRAWIERVPLSSLFRAQHGFQPHQGAAFYSQYLTNLRQGVLHSVCAFGAWGLPTFTRSPPHPPLLLVFFSCFLW